MTGATTATKSRSVCLICLKRFGRVTEPGNGDDNTNNNGVIVPYQSRMLVPFIGLGGQTSHASGSDDDNQQGDHRSNDLYSRFLLLTSRYLKVPMSETLLAFAKQHKSTTGENVQAFCDQCQILVGYVCDLYAELQAVKLHLVRKVEELETVTRQSVKCVSLKLSRGLFKTVAEQLNIKSVRQLELFRKSVILNCNRKRKGSTPHVLVPRGLFPEQWKYTYAATKLALMRLIVIFALVSLSATKVEKKPEGILKTKGALKRKTDGRRKVAFQDIAHKFLEKRTKRKAEVSFKKDADVEGNNDSSFYDADDNDGDFPDTGGDDNDSDWSTGAASPTGSADSAGSDVNANSDVDSNNPISRKRRRRLRKTRPQRLAAGIVKVICEEDGEEEDDDDDDDCTTNDPDFKAKTGNRTRGRFKQRSSSINNKDATIPCKICKKLFVDRRGLAKHLREIHNTHLDYNCDICGLLCKTAADMTTHRRLQHPGYSSDGTVSKNANLPCPKCKRKFVDTRGLSRHMLGAHNSRLEYTCNICGHKSKTAADRMTHRSKMHKRTGGFRSPRGMRGIRRGLNTSCRLCNKQFISKAEFVRHYKEVHKDDQCGFKCPVCMKQIASEQLLARHLLNHEQDSSILCVFFYCEVCGKSLSSEDALSEHFVSVHNGSYSCSMCDAKYPASSFLRTHLETHETAEKKYFCNFCYRGYTNEQYWQIHRKFAHVGKNRMFCDQDRCAEEFSNVQDLNEHLKKHIEELQTKDSTEINQKANDKNGEGETAKEISNSEKDRNQDSKDKIVSCGTCGWGFLNKYRLTLHELVHIPFLKEDGGYNCPIENCSKVLRLKQNLISHYNYAHGEKSKPLECHECNHKFGSFIWYKIHLRMHEERKSGKKFICDICDFECLDSIALCAHKRIHDPNENSTETGKFPELREKRRWIPKRKTEDGSIRRRGRPPMIPKTEEQIRKAQEKAEKFANVPCEVCQVTCESGSSLRKHLEKEHEQVPNEEKLIQCNFCYLKFVYKQTHELHMISMHMQTYKFVCDAERCDARFLNHVDLNNHLIKTHLEITEELQQEMNETECKSVPDGGSSSVPEELSVEARDSSNDKVQAAPPPVKVKVITYCKTCDWGFVNPDLLELHELYHTREQSKAKFPCPVCDLTCSSTVRLISHYNTAHGKKLRPFRCLKCPAKFFTKYGLRLHISRHDRRRNMADGERFVCIDCGRGFMDIYLLNHHRKQHDPANHVTCSECGQTFNNKVKLNIHLKKKHGHGERFPCPVCGITFISEYETRKHIEWTHGPPKYECDVCHKKYKRPGGLRKHKAEHRPDAGIPEAYMCYECGSHYKTEEGLKYHIGSKHTPEDQKRFACPECPYKTHRRGLFKMHLKVCLRNKGIPYDEEKWGKLPVVKPQYTGPPRKPGRKPGWKRKQKNEEEEDEMEEKSTTEDEEEEEEEEEKHDVQQQPVYPHQQQTPAPPSSSTANVINAIIANLTGLPELGTLNEPSHHETSTPKRGRRGSTRRQSKETTANNNASSSSTTFPSTIDHSLLQSMSHQQLLPHQMPNHPQLFGNTNAPNYQNWLNTTSAGLVTTSTASSFAHPFQQQPGNNEQKPNFNHTPPPPHTQHGHHQQHQNVVYSPNHVYSPPLQDQPRNLHYGARK